MPGTGAIELLNNSLKLTYPQEILEPFVNKERPFTDGWLNKSLPASAKISEGNLVKFAFYLDPPENQGMMADGDDYPTPIDRTEIQGTIQGVLFSASFMIGEVTRHVAASSRVAFNGGEPKRRVQETLEGLGKYMEQVFLMTHGTGRFGTVEAEGSTANTLVVAQPEGNTNAWRVNRRFSERTTDGGDTVTDSIDYRKITNYDPDTRILTYAQTDQTAVAGDHLHFVTKAAQTSLSTISANGIRGLVDDGTHRDDLHGQSRATYLKLKAVVSGYGGQLRDLSEQILVRHADKIFKLTGKYPTDIWMGLGQAEKFLEFVAPDRRYPSTGRGPTQFNVGYNKSSLAFQSPGGEIPISLSTDIVPREIFFLNRAYLWHYQAKKMGWWDEGAMLKPVPTSGGFKAAYFAALTAIENIGTDYPRMHGVIRDLKDPECGD